MCCCAAVGAACFWPGTASALPAGQTAGALSFLRLCLAAPLAEELLYRGAVQGLLSRPLGVWAAAAQAVLFALGHAGGAQQAYALIFGLALGWLRLRAKSIWPGFAAHCANNALLYAMLYYKGAIL